MVYTLKNQCIYTLNSGYLLGISPFSLWFFWERQKQKLENDLPALNKGWRFLTFQGIFFSFYHTHTHKHTTHTNTPVTINKADETDQKKRAWLACWAPPPKQEKPKKTYPKFQLYLDHYSWSESFSVWFSDVFGNPLSWRHDGSRPTIPISTRWTGGFLHKLFRGHNKIYTTLRQNEILQTSGYMQKLYDIFKCV